MTNQLNTRIIDAITPLVQQLNCLDIQQISKVCTEQLPKLIGARFVSLYLLDPASDMLYLETHNHTWLINNIISLNQENISPMIKAVREKELVIVKNTSDVADRFNDRFSDNYLTPTCIIAPLICNNRVVGVINLADKVNAEEFTHQDIATIELFRYLIGASIGNINMYEAVQVQARTDGLTGLSNHKTFYELLEKELRRCQRYGGQVSTIMVDIDNFKNINDTFGHRAGDAAIKKVTTKILACIRKIDIAARYGGDEFAVILPSSTIEDARTVAERIVKEVSAMPIMWEMNKIQLSVSVGVGQFDSSMTPEEITRCSDSALYAAKQAGKNTFKIFEMTKNG
ncbi:MAG: sensor domain-containing diguanylate cyclase [Planctomycetaceae bacterium]|nr:sensor domain-containing diguanylate cyclase [Planctomycetaceae bacterium]